MAVSTRTDEDIQASEQLESSPLSEELGPPPTMGVAAAHAPSPTAGPHPPTSMGEHVMMHHGPSSPLLSGDTETVQNRPGLRVAK